MEQRHHTHVDPNVGIPDLVRRLTDDSKRLAQNEVKLAKLEVSDAVHTGTRGAMWLGAAFGVSVVAAVGLTVFLVSVLGRLLGDRNYWLGALIVGVAWLAIGFLLIKRGTRTVAEQPYSLPESRAEVANTAVFVKSARAD